MTQQAENHNSSLNELLQALPTVHAPDDFEQETFVRVMLDQLPRARAPQSFEDNVLARLREDDQSRRKLRLRRLPRSARWLVAGMGAAIAGAIGYYLATRNSDNSPLHPELTTPQPLPVEMQLDSGIEQRLLRQENAPKKVQRHPTAPEQHSSAPTKRVTPGAPNEDE